jgi:hypothetical protein
LAVRLTYAGVEHEVITDLKTAVEWCPKTKLYAHSDTGQPRQSETPLPSRYPVEQPVDVIATYTPFQKLLKMAGLR